MNRKEFIQSASMGALFLALYPESFIFPEYSSSENKSACLIGNIKLLTSTALERIKVFYAEKLGFPILNEYVNEITFGAGTSTITFVKVNSSFGSPWYHFAFNIPENKILEARTWQLKRSKLIQTPKNKRDPGFPNDIRHFKHWNAHSIVLWINSFYKGIHC